MKFFFSKPYDHFWIFWGTLNTCFKLCQSLYNFVNVLITFEILNQVFSVFYHRLYD